MDFQLTSGSCEQLQVTAPDDSPLTRAPHILQVLSLRNVTVGSSGRFRMILSDGVHFIQSLLAYALSPVVESGHIARNTIIIVSSVDLARISYKGRRVRLVVILGAQVLCQAPHRIGNPTGIVEDIMQEPVATLDGGQAGSSHDNTTPLALPALVVSESTYIGGAPIAPATGDLQPPDEQLSITPIEYLYPSKTSWMIEGVVKEKSELKAWFNRHLGLEHKLFTMILSDDSGSIRANVMSEGAEEIYSSLEEGKVYRIKKPKIIMAKKRLSGLSHDWEILFGKETRIVGPIYPN